MAYEKLGHHELQAFATLIHKGINSLLTLVAFCKDYKVQEARFQLLTDWAYYTIFVEHHHDIDHRNDARDKEVTELTLNTLIKLGSEIDKSLLESKLGKRQEN